MLVKTCILWQLNALAIEIRLFRHPWEARVPVKMPDCCFLGVCGLNQMKIVSIVENKGFSRE